MTQAAPMPQESATPFRPPSLFNDVVGPVMRGPSSSHTAASIRIGRIARDLMESRLESVLIEFHPAGSLATTHEDQGSDMGLFGGLLGWEATDHRLADSAQFIREAGIDVEIRLTDFPATHPNTYKLTLRGGEQEHILIALSTGGGMIEMVSIDDIPVSWVGDSFATLLRVDSIAPDVLADWEKRWPSFRVSLHPSEDGRHSFLLFQGGSFLTKGQCESLGQQLRVHQSKFLAPVLPVLTPKGMTVPFLTSEEMLAYRPESHRSLAEWAISYECARGGIEEQEVVDKMADIVRLLKTSIEAGIRGTHFEDRILGHQCGTFGQMMAEGKLLEGGMLNRMILYVSSLMEVKSSMGIIVAAPTAGSCGAMPGTLIAAAEEMGLDERATVDAFLAAGLIGMFVAAHSSFAAEVGGCQAETGAGAAMAAAGLVNLAGGSPQQALGAASMALQNTLGLICDPVANRVEAPCLGRNINAASNALSSANVALAHFDALIPLDEVIATHYKVGQSIPCELRCTALGGLSITKTSREIEARLKGKATPTS